MTKAQPYDYVPPLVIDRVIATYTFEGGGFVSVVAGGRVETALVLDMVEKLIALKRQEISAKASPEEIK